MENWSMFRQPHPIPTAAGRIHRVAHAKTLCPRIISINNELERTGAPVSTREALRFGNFECCPKGYEGAGSEGYYPIGCTTDAKCSAKLNRAPPGRCDLARDFHDPCPDELAATHGFTALTFTRFPSLTAASTPEPAPCSLPPRPREPFLSSDTGWRDWCGPECRRGQ